MKLLCYTAPDGAEIEQKIPDWAECVTWDGAGVEAWKHKPTYADDLQGWLPDKRRKETISIRIDAARGRSAKIRKCPPEKGDYKEQLYWLEDIAA